MNKNSYSQVQVKEVDAILSAAPPDGLTIEELEKWYNRQMMWLSEMEAGEALYLEPAIENDYDFIRGGC